MDKYEFLIIEKAGILNVRAQVVFGGNDQLNSTINKMKMGNAIAYLGDNGWELASYVPSTEVSNPTASFKRKKQE